MMGRYGKIKLHFTRDGSRRRSRRSREARPLCGTSWSRPRRGAGSVSPRVPSDMRTGRPGRANRGRTACRDPWPRPTRESLPDPPRGLYRAVTDTSPRGAWVATCVRLEPAALGRTRAECSSFIRVSSPGPAAAVLACRRHAWHSRPAPRSCARSWTETMQRPRTALGVVPGCCRSRCGGRGHPRPRRESARSRSRMVHPKPAPRSHGDGVVMARGR
jgi:hypothetical protein